jgi:hypothetical protein
MIAGARYAASRAGRGSVRVMVGGQVLEATAGQAARLAVAEARARNTIQKVHELDPDWKPNPSLRETIEGAIATANGEAREAQARLDELALSGIGLGPFARESIPAVRGAGRRLTTKEREQLNEIGNKWGCHTCGTLDAIGQFCS